MTCSESQSVCHSGKVRTGEMAMESEFFLCQDVGLSSRQYSKCVQSIRIQSPDGLGQKAKNCKIHPTAVIEACEIGDNVEIGPYAVVRASIIGDGAKIEEHATVNLSVLGPNSRAARYAMINLCVLMEDAFVSRGGGFQMSLYGKGCFIAVDAVMLDLSFGKTIRVLDNNDEWVDSKQHFWGVVLVTVPPLEMLCDSIGVSVPNDALLVANADELILDASGAEPNVPARVNDRHGVDTLQSKAVKWIGCDLIFLVQAFRGIHL